VSVGTPRGVADRGRKKDHSYLFKWKMTNKEVPPRGVRGDERKSSGLCYEKTHFLDLKKKKGVRERGGGEHGIRRYGGIMTRTNWRGCRIGRRGSLVGKTVGH